MSPQRSVLIVEDSPSVALLLKKSLQQSGYDVLVVTSGETFYQWLETGLPVGVVLLDLVLPDADGLELQRRLLEQRPDTPVIIISGHGTIERAVECMKLGAYDFLAKPIDMTRLQIALDHALERRQLQTKVSVLEAEQARRSGFGTLIGQSAAMQGLYTVIQNVGPSAATVLITGETGVGKELVARTIHAVSPRAAGPFVAVNCGALPRELIESELFGHEEGAYTGATRQTTGKCAQADGGTLFLDEVSEIAIDLQVNLLRFLQDQEIQRIGSETAQIVDVRVIAATNRDPRQEVREGRMREDLYYRLNVVPVSVPPLRDRNEDIVELAEAFLDECSATYKKHFDGFDNEAVLALLAYSWPGNVRELRNVVERIVVMNVGGTIGTAHLPDEIHAPANALPETLVPPATRRVSREIRPIAQLEREAVEKAYRLCEGNVNLMAQRLEMSVSTLYRRIKELGLSAGV